MRVNELKLVGAQPSTAASPARILEEAEVATDSKGGERDVGAPKFLALYIHTDALLSYGEVRSAPVPRVSSPARTISRPPTLPVAWGPACQRIGMQHRWSRETNITRAPEIPLRCGFHVRRFDDKPRSSLRWQLDPQIHAVPS